jgi:uncharacterized protein (TIGR02117 family)
LSKGCFVAPLKALAIVVLGCVVVLVMGALVPRPGDLPSTEFEGSIPIYVASNGIHTDLILPVKVAEFDLSKAINLDPLMKAEPESTFLEIGWGEELVYTKVATWDDLTWRIALQSMFFSPGSLMHVNVTNERPEAAEWVRVLHLDKTKYEKLSQYVVGSFQRNGQSRAELSHPGYGRYDGFYRAHGHYSVLNTCNSWTAVGLREIGIRTPLWSATSQALMWHLQPSQ